MTVSEKFARNERIQNRYDELMREGKHGHYETLFCVVREEIEAARREMRERAANRLRKLIEYTANRTEINAYIYAESEIRSLPLNPDGGITRVEVIDHSRTGSGRAYVKWDGDITAALSFQDNGRTLKVFITDRSLPLNPEGGT